MGEQKFNVPEPDASAEDILQWLLGREKHSMIVQAVVETDSPNAAESNARILGVPRRAAEHYVTWLARLKKENMPMYLEVLGQYRNGSR